jgi:PKD repeat protein
LYRILLCSIHFNLKAQCLSGWKYFMPIVVVNNTSSSLSYYQVKVTLNTANLISNGKMVKTGDDIRFLDSGSCQPIPYWIESGINTSTTIIWVKLPSLPGSAHRTIRMYYGNSSAAAVSNGDSTFVIFDDFNGTSLNTTKWASYTSGSGASIKVSGGDLVCTTTLEANIRSTSYFSSPLIEEAKMDYISGSWETMAILNSGTLVGYTMVEGDANTGSNTLYFGPAFKPGNPACISYTSSTYNATTPGTLTGLWQLSWPSSNVQSCKWPGGSLSTTNTSVTLNSSVQIAIGEMCGATGSMSVDWVRARKAASAEATTTNGSESTNPTIQASAVSGSPFCAGAPINVPFSIVGSLSFNSGNIFTAQLSDSSGTFNSPSSIGTYTGTSAGTISGIIPATAYSSSHYKIRIISSSPALTGIPSSYYISVNALSVPGFIVNASKQCFSSNSFIFTNTTTGSGTIKYEWDFGDGFASNADSTTYSYSTPGNYTVTLYATNSYGCKDSTSQSMSVFPKAVAGFTANNTSSCFQNQNFVFTNTSSISSGSLKYIWNFKDGSLMYTGTNAIHTFKNAGSFAVSLTATSDKGCVDTFIKNITINPTPVTGFSSSSNTVCTKQPSFIFTNTSSISTGTLKYIWNFGDGSSTYNGTNASHSYSATGTFTVSLTATSDKGCIDSISKNYSVYQSPSAGFNIKNASMCLKQQNLVLTNTSSIPSGLISYIWNFGDGSPTSTATNPIYTYKKAGNFNVNLTVTSDNGCIDSISKIITILPNPTATITVTGPIIFCQGGSVTLNSNTGTGFFYQWFHNNVPQAGSTNASYIATSSGTYKVAITNSTGCIDTSSIITVKVNPLPAIPVITKNGKVLNSSKAASYQWYLNGGLVSGANSQTYTPSLSKGAVTVMITDSNGCTSTSSVFNYDVTAVENFTFADEIEIYPNPVRDNLYVDLSKAKDKFLTIAIIDINGKTLYRRPISEKDYTGSIEINISMIDQGIYILKISGKENTLTVKLIKN